MFEFFSNGHALLSVCDFAVVCGSLATLSMMHFSGQEYTACTWQTTTMALFVFCVLDKADLGFLRIVY